MVSIRLRNLAAFFREKAACGGVTLDADKCELLLGQLDACADAAQGMENGGAPVDPPAAVAHIPANLVRLADARHARTLRASGAGDWGAA
jgi:hypothetical protein